MIVLRLSSLDALTRASADLCAALCSVGQVDYNEFLEGMSSFKRSGDKALRFCFDIYDKDGVGCINLEQLKAVLSCVTSRQSLHGLSGDIKAYSGGDHGRLLSWSLKRSMCVDNTGFYRVLAFSSCPLISREPTLVGLCLP